MSSKDDSSEKQRRAEELVRRKRLDSLNSFSRGRAEERAQARVYVPPSQNVIDPKGNRKVVASPSGTEGGEAPRVPIVNVKHGSRHAVFYSVTEDEIENHAQLGFLSSISLTLFGTTLGFVLGCLVALIQGDLSETATTVFVYLALLTAVFTLIFLVASIYLWRLRKRNSQVWKSQAEV